jgi:capsular exopolysaccharide synthesis family protein
MEEDDFDDEPQSSSRSRQKRHNTLLPALLGRWYWIALMLLLGVLGSLYYLSKAPKIYTANTTLALTLPARGMMSGGRAQFEEIDTTTVEGLNTIAARLGRFELLARVAARADVLALRGILPPEVDWRPSWWIRWAEGEDAVAPAAIDARALPQNSIIGIIGEGFEVSVRPKTRLLDISFHHPDPEVARVLADAIATEYVAEAEQIASENRATQSSTLTRQAQDASNKLAETNAALGNYVRVLQLHQELEAQETAYAALSLRYRPKYPDMVDAKGRLDDTKRRFLAELNTAMTSPVDAPYWQTAAVPINAATDQETRLAAARQALLSRVSVLNAQAKSQETLLQTMSTSNTMGDVDRETSDISIRLDSKALLPSEPSAPVVPTVLAIGSGGGLAIGLLLAFLFAKLDNKFHSVAQLEAETEVPVLAAISQINPNHLAQAVGSARKRGKDVSLNDAQKLWDPLLLFRPGLSSTNFCENFRVLRASVALLGDETRRRVTLFTSSLPGEGKSMVSANFALASAALGRKTLLIDLDLRKPRQHKVFGISRKQHGKAGSTEWCARQATMEEAIITDTGAPNLHIIVSGRRAPNPGELLQAERLREMFDEATAQYDVVVVDTAPLLAVPDTRLIAPLVDNLCLIVRASWVPKGAVERSLDLLDSADTPPSGLVLNGYAESRRRITQNYTYGSYRMSRFGKAVQYGYGSYGSYGHDHEDDHEDESGEESPERGKGRKKPEAKV